MNQFELKYNKKLKQKVKAKRFNMMNGDRL